VALRTNPTVEQARAFIAAADAPTYKEAAKRLPSGTDSIRVQRLVRRLAKAIGSDPLVVSDWRGVLTLTEAGRDALEMARRFVDAGDALHLTPGRLLFSAYPVIATRLVAARPDLIEGPKPLELFEISEVSRNDGGAELVRRVASGRLDIAIAPAGMAGAERTLREHPLYTWSLRIALPQAHPKANSESVTPADVADLRFVVAPRGHLSRELVEGAFNVAGMKLNVLLEAESQFFMNQVAHKSRSLAAAIPDDAFGTTGRRIGPVLTSHGKTLGGNYAIYVRKGRVGAARSRREQQIDAMVKQIASAFPKARSKSA
jgi:DNA-binding transcriptional LysR family regulator